MTATIGVDVGADIELTEHEQFDWIRAKYLLPGDQLASGHFITALDDTLIVHIKVTVDGDTAHPRWVHATEPVRVIIPAWKPTGFTEALRELVGAPIALPATTGE